MIEADNLPTALIYFPDTSDLHGRYGDPHRLPELSGTGSREGKQAKLNRKLTDLQDDTATLAGSPCEGE